MIKEIFTNFAMAALAIALSLVMMPLGLVFAIVFIVFKMDSEITTKYLSRVFFNVAKSLDILGNYVCAVLFNFVLIKKNESMYRFGKEGETISSALGKNFIVNNLTVFGKALNDILNFIDRYT